MKSRLPAFLDKDKICIICEGDEEFDYLSRLKDLGVWNEKYEISLDNADGNGNIPARYQDRYQNGSYEMVLVFCDTEKKPYEQYEDINERVSSAYEKDMNLFLCLHISFLPSTLPDNIRIFVQMVVDFFGSISQAFIAEYPAEEIL